MQALKVGDPLDPATDIGPLATPQIADELDQQVRQHRGRRRRCLPAGTSWQGGAIFTPPRCWPTFRPIRRGHRRILRAGGAGVSSPRFRRVDRLANASSFGLGSSIWTSDAAEQDRFADEIEAGLAFVNAVVASDTLLPFGGIKRSGYGRELSIQGLRKFVNIKTVDVGG